MDMYSVIISNSISTDGLGIPSISLFYGGCDKKEFTGYFCPNCHNAELQDNFNIPKYSNLELCGYIELFLEDWSQISDIVAISFIGGEPMAANNRESVRYISNYLKNKYSYVRTILYTWRTVEDLKTQGILNYLEDIDCCVCGEYLDKYNSGKSIFGSTNQYAYNYKNNKFFTEKEIKELLWI